MGFDEQIRSLTTELQTMTNQAKTAYAALEAKTKQGEEPSGEERTALNTLIDAGEIKRKELDRLKTLDENDAFVNRPAGEQRARESGVAGRTSPKSWGQMVVTNPAYQAFAKGVATASSTGAKLRMDGIDVKAEQKALYESTSSTGGALIQEMRDDMLIELPFRPPSVLDLINVVPTTSNSVEYVRMASRTNAAVPVATYTSGNFALKPESDMTFELITAAVKTVATFVRAGRMLLMDAPALQDLIDTQLTNMLRVKLEDQIINGDGTGQNFTGIVATSGLQLRTQGTASGGRGEATDTIADTIRRGITDIQLEFYTPDGILLNPIDAEKVELSKSDDKQYVMVYDAATGRIWRTPVVVSPVTVAGTGIIGAWRLGATLWDRMSTDIRIGEPNDDFLRNAVAVLAELRAAFGVIRPAAFEKQTYNGAA